MMRIGSLFSGIGGLDLGLEWAGVGHTVWQVERDPWARSILAKHWPDIPRYDDVRTVTRDTASPIEVLCGGFPCQDLSFAGKGAGINGARSGLFFELMRIADDMGPRFIVLENVSAILTRGLDVVLGRLAESGYDAWWDCIPASTCGAAHRRDRWFLVGYAGCYGGVWRSKFQAEPNNKASIGPCAEDNGARNEGRGPTVANTGGDGRRDCSTAGDGCGMEGSGSGSGVFRAWSAEAVRSGNSDANAGKPRSSVESILGRTSDGLPPGLDRYPKGVGAKQHPWEPPRIHEEAPDDADRLRGLGNAVVPQVGWIIGKALLSLA